VHCPESRQVIALQHRSKKHRYLIASSARVSNVAGIVNLRGLEIYD
jgi:hypothetical protein